TAFRATGRMRRVPGLRRLVVAQAPAIDVSEHRSALRALGPVAAGAILACRESAAIRLRAGQRVVIVRRRADARYDSAALGQRGLLAELVVGAVQIIDVLRDGLFLEVHPRAAADAVARVNGLAATRRLRAQVSVPGFVAGTDGLCKLLAVAISAFEP